MLVVKYVWMFVTKKHYILYYISTGDIKAVSGAKTLKYKLRNKKALIKDVNGLIRNPTRLL